MCSLTRIRPMGSDLKRERPLAYWDVCHGIPPLLIGSPRDFMSAQAFVVVVALIVLIAASCA
jgi:hypothetical protein